MGVAAVSAAAISSGIVTTTPAASNVTFVDQFVPPVCSASSLLKEGYFELKIQGFPPSAFPDRKRDVELLFRDIYNDITGMHVASSRVFRFPIKQSVV